MMMQVEHIAPIVKTNLKLKCYCSDAYILVKRTIKLAKTGAEDVDKNNINKKVISKNCAAFIDCIREINNIQVDNAKVIDVAMLM